MTSTQATWPSWRSCLGADALASVVVFLVALPLCMGVAIASGLPPAAGLVTGIVGGIVVGAIAGSPLQVSGPAAGLAVMVWQLVQEFGVATLGIIVLLAGVVQIAAGLFRVGQVFRAVSPAVISPKGSGLQNLISIPAAIKAGLVPIDGSFQHQAAIVGVITIVTVLLWVRFAPKRLRLVPAPLVGVIAGVAAAHSMSFGVKFVNVPDDLLATLQFPTMESLGSALNPAVLKAAVAVAIIASAETLLCATAIDQRHDGPRTNYDRELVAQGVGNSICGVLGSLPMTGVIVRSSANVEAGARTRTSAILHGVWILVLVMAAPSVLEAIPVSALAAILVFTGYKLVNPTQAKALWKQGRAEFGIFALTLVGIVGIDLLTGVALGVAASFIKLVYTFTHLRIRKDVRGETVHLHLDGAATFLRVPALAAAFESVPRSSELHVHVERLTHVDHAALEVIMGWERQATRAGGKLVMEWDEVHTLYKRARPIPELAVAAVN